MTEMGKTLKMVTALKLDPSCKDSKRVWDGGSVLCPPSDHFRSSQVQRIKMSVHGLLHLLSHGTASTPSL